jgi:hypothetical protein
VRRTILTIAVAVAVLAFPAAASAATIVVNSTAGASTPGVCTLREAILSANNDLGFASCAAGSGADRIEFALASGSKITLATELAEIKGNLEIVGPGAGALTVSGNNVARTFNVGGPNTVISGLTISEGFGTFGGGLSVASAGQLELRQVVVKDSEALVNGGGSAFAVGGGINNSGSLKLVETTVEGNVARSSGATGANAPSGGGISSGNEHSVLVLERSTVRGNESVGAGVGGASSTNANGGGISNTGSLTLVASTVSGNLAKGSGGGSSNSATGGGIADANAPTSLRVTIERSTIAGNTASASGTGASTQAGGISFYAGLGNLVSSSTIAGNSAANGANVQVSGVTQVRSTIIAKPLVGGSCSAALTSLGYNLEETTGCGLTQPTDQHSVNPLLGALAANGGATQTMALAQGSPALDRGLAPAGEAADQRGLRRPVDIAQLPNAVGGNGADVGAYELQVPVAAITRGPGEGETIADPEPSFEFGTEEAGATFVCSLDGAAAAPCASPFKAPRLADGAHTFAVTAVATFGYSDAIATTRQFTVDTRVRERPTEPDRPVTPIVPPKRVAPQSKILGLPGTTTKRKLMIRFSATVARSTFACKLDKRPWRSCRSPYKTPELALGKHVFKLRATAPTGLADPTPAVKKFKVVAPKPRG